MLSLKKIIDEIKIDLKDFKGSDRINYLDKLLQAKTNAIRATLIGSEFKTKGKVNDAYYLPTCCIEITCQTQGCIVDGVIVPSGIVLWQTNNMPNLIEEVGDLNIKYIGLDNYSKPFKRVSLSSFINSDGDIWNKHDVLYYIMGNTAYFKNLPSAGIKFICVSGLWEAPTSICNYNLMTDVYPVPSVDKLKIMLRMSIMKSWGWLPDTPAPTGEAKTIDLSAGANKSVQQDNGQQ